MNQAVTAGFMKRVPRNNNMNILTLIRRASRKVLINPQLNRVRFIILLCTHGFNNVILPATPCYRVHIEV